MNCPFCQNVDSKVNDSRPDAGGRSIRRRRECLACGKRWRTLERIEDEMPLVIKRNQTYQPFDRAKLSLSINIACGKRPVSQTQIEKAVADIEWGILESGVDSVSTTKLGEMVMHHLRMLDEIAYVRYASVYRRFSDVGELIAEMKDLVRQSDLSVAAHASAHAPTHPPVHE
ncbi:MAG: transcriptional repressor NrdR [Bdellovibrionales bacterium]|nr:transcriptional repressor NrdR [Bdellovibrionales bacterium]